MNRVLDHIKHLFERSLFGVCEYWGHKFGVASSKIRVYFIYVSFLTLGSPVLFYLIAAFWLNIRRYIRRGNLLME